MQKKRLLGLAMALLLVVSCIAGCGSAGGTGSSGSSGGGRKTKFYIGGIGPATGEAAVYGSCVKNAAQMAVDEINRNGGINGYQVEYRFEDDANDPEKAVAAYYSLKDWGMQILMGTVTTTPCIAVAEESSSDNMFEITPSASSTDIILDNDNVYQVCFTDPNQGTASADYIADSMDKEIRKVAVIYDSSSAYSTGIHDNFITEAGEKDIDIVSDTDFTGDTNTDFTAQLKKARKSGAELIFLPVYYQEAAAILQQADDMDYDPVFFGVDGMDGILTLEDFDTSLAEGVMLLTPFSPYSEDEKTKKFVEDYQEAWGDIPNQFGADAYDAIYIIKTAIEQANINPESDVSVIGGVLQETMMDFTFKDGLTGYEMEWDEYGAVNKEPKAAVIEKGKYRILD